MPIKINLLAEAQAAEELRRRDPVKRGIFLGATFVVLMLIWGGMGQINLTLAKGGLTGVQTAIDSHNAEYTIVMANLNKIAEAKNKLAALQKLQASRFLQGNLLNALQQATVDGVQLTRMRIEQSYFLTEGTPSKTNDVRVIQGRPGTSRERIIMTLDARDYSANPGDQVNNFKQVIAGQSYFKAILGKTNSVELVGLPSLQTGPDGKTFELFTVGCNFPEQTR
jgi:transcriptional regulator of aromatic amino acid metabolism